MVYPKLNFTIDPAHLTGNLHACRTIYKTGSGLVQGNRDVA
jgi:hypothetical protein